jgi:hypothetical protein
MDCRIFCKSSDTRDGWWIACASMPLFAAVEGAWSGAASGSFASGCAAKAALSAPPDTMPIRRFHLLGSAIASAAASTAALPLPTGMGSATKTESVSGRCLPSLESTSQISCAGNARPFTPMT